MGTRPASQHRDLSHLSNSIDFQRTSAGRFLVQLAVDSATGAPSHPTPPQDGPQAERADTVVPESVLQYQRHLREVKANQKSLRPLTIEEHLKVVYEDDAVIVTNKPSGVLCVPGLNNKTNLLLDLVCQHCNLSLQERSKRIVHRWDMDTSGIVLYSKTDEASNLLQASFRDWAVEKEYQALFCLLYTSPSPRD